MSYTILNPGASDGILRRLQGVLFDMDGLVLDTEKLYTRFWMEACHFYGCPMTIEQALCMRSIGRQQGADNLRRFFGPDVDYAQVHRKRVELMDAFVEKEGVCPKPGARELLTFLRERGIRTSIATSSPMDRATAHLGSVGLLELFDEVCSGYNVPNPKPAPDIYLYAAEKLGVDPAKCLALEDSPSGLKSASRAGCFPIMIPDQDQPTEQTLKLLYAKADSLNDIIALIRSADPVCP